MGDDDLAGPEPAPPRPTTDAGGWRPVERDGRLWVGASRNQRLAFTLRWTLLTQIVVVLLNVAATATRTGRGFFAPALYVGTVGLALGACWWASGRPGIELGPATVLLVPSFGRRSRTLRWSGVLFVESTSAGTVALSVAGEAPIEATAPVEHRWGVTDPDYEVKVDAILAWWRDRRGRAPEVAARVAARSAARAAEHRQAPEPEAAEPEEAPFPTVVLLALFGVSVVIGYLFTGPTVLVLAFAMLVLLRFGRDPARPLALAAFLLLVVAAITTIVPEPLEANLTYASRRTIAAEAGAILGVFLVLATLIFAVTERSPQAAPKRPLVHLPSKAVLVAAVGAVPGWLRLAVPYAVTIGGALVVRFVLAPGGLTASAYDPLLRNIRLGNNFSLGAMNPPGALPSGPDATALYAPAAPLLVAFSPIGARLLLVLAATVLVALVAWVTYRRYGVAASVVAAGVATVLPSMWDQQLPNTLAAGCVLVGVALATPSRLTGGRAFAAGLALGLAVTARPDAVLASVVVVVWWFVAGERRDLRLLPALAVGWVLAAQPWLTFVWSNFGFPRLAETIGATLNDPSAQTRVPGLIGLVLGAAAVAVLLVLSPRLGERRLILPYLVLPLVCLALTLTSFPTRDPLTWSAPLVAVLLGAELVAFLPAGVRRWLDVPVPPPLDVAEADGSGTTDTPLVVESGSVTGSSV